jgi:hypothetical protein
MPKSDGEAKVADKTAYLIALRAATTELQSQINTELTARMDEDKAREAAGKESGGDETKKVVDEDAEEENYGEEVQEEDD